MNSNQQQDEIEIDLLEILYVLGRKIWIILLAAIVCGGILWGYSSYMMPKIYESSSQLYILTQSTSITSLADIQSSTSLTQDYKELIKSRPVVDQVIENLKLNRSYANVLQQITIDNPTNTRIINITAQDVDPQLAKALADEFANVSRERISDIMMTDAPTVAQYGYAAQKPVSPNILKNTLIGALVGIFIACAIIIVMFILDDTVKTAEDIEKYLGLNTLTSIPVKQDEQKKKKKNKNKGGIK